MHPKRNRAHSASEGARDHQRSTPTAQVPLPSPSFSNPASSQLNTEAPFSYGRFPEGPHPDPFADLFRTMGETYETHLPHHPTSPPNFSPHQQPQLPQMQVDANTLAWLQLLQAQGQGHQLPLAPPLNQNASGSRGRDEGRSRSATNAAPVQSEDGNEDEDDQSGGEGSAVAQDKRRRNTAASARFRNKKKQWVLNLERTATNLSRRVEELEREASDLRRENGWLKEIVMLKTSRGTTQSDSADDDRRPSKGKGKERERSP